MSSMLSAMKWIDMESKWLFVNSCIIAMNSDAASIPAASLLNELGRPLHGPLPEAMRTPVFVLIIHPYVIPCCLADPSDTTRRKSSLVIAWTMEWTSSNCMLCKSCWIQLGWFFSRVSQSMDGNGEGCWGIGEGKLQYLVPLLNDMISMGWCVVVGWNTMDWCWGINVHPLR